MTNGEPSIPQTSGGQVCACILTMLRSSLAYGTPPHILDGQYDVPSPVMSYFDQTRDVMDAAEAESVFTAFFGLTEVLNYYLQHLYRVDQSHHGQILNLEFRINQWVESLETGVRRIITRGTHLNLPGAANLRLSYLSVMFLLRRLELEDDRETHSTDSDLMANRCMQVRRTGEEIILLVQELQDEHLGDFWLPVSAFVFPSMTTYLLRCALETGSSKMDLAQNTSLRLAWELVTALRNHRDRSGWDLGDICLTQHAEIVERLMMPPTIPTEGVSDSSLQEMAIPDVSFIDQLFPSLWDTFRDV
jgi:hypothetical protein